MLKNTKVVGIAAAITLLTGVALAPSATGVGNELPSQTVNIGDTAVSAGERVTYSIADVRTGCRVTTTLGSKTRVERATGVVGDTNKIIGEIVDAYITAPSVAGAYTLRSRVNRDCKTDAGFSNSWLMSDEIIVGTEVTLDSVLVYEGETADDDIYANWENLDNGSVRMYGWVEVDNGEDAGDSVDLGAVKVNFVVKGKTVASAYTDNDGYVVVSIEKKFLNKRGNTKVTLELGANRTNYIDQYFVVDRIGG